MRRHARKSSRPSPRRREIRQPIERTTGSSRGFRWQDDVCRAVWAMAGSPELKSSRPRQCVISLADDYDRGHAKATTRTSPL
jgi:hypothetical protein